MILYLRDDLARAWAGDDVFSRLRNLPGEIYRHKEGRKTLRFELDGKGYFLKLHLGVGWGEIVKNLIQLRPPVVGAENEWRAIEACRANDIDSLTIAGYGKRGLNPARQQSFLITDELTGVQSLEDYCRRWQQSPPPYAVKKTLVSRVAAIARRFHGAGINHRDFYLCHFLLGGDPETRREAVFSSPIYLIDLHRARIRGRVPRRWLVKDLGALYYSALHCGLNRRDILRFVRIYGGPSAVVSLRRDSRFWHQVRARAERIYRRDFGRAPDFPI